MRRKKRYEGGELVETVKTQNAGRASLDQLKPPKGLNFYEVSVPRKANLLVIRHEEGGGKDHFAGSILCLSPMGLIWIDSRVVVCVLNMDGGTSEH
jgi:hypothetical protein